MWQATYEKSCFRGMVLHHSSIVSSWTPGVWFKEFGHICSGRSVHLPLCWWVSLPYDMARIGSREILQEPQTNFGGFSSIYTANIPWNQFIEMEFVWKEVSPKFHHFPKKTASAWSFPCSVRHGVTPVRISWKILTLSSTPSGPKPSTWLRSGGSQKKWGILGHNLLA